MEIDCEHGYKKVAIFHKGRLSSYIRFLYDNAERNTKRLSLLMYTSGCAFVTAQTTLAEQGQKALFKMGKYIVQDTSLIFVTEILLKKTSTWYSETPQSTLS